MSGDIAAQSQIVRTVDTLCALSYFRAATLAPGRDPAMLERRPNGEIGKFYSSHCTINEGKIT